MVNRLIIENGRLAEQIQQVATQEHRSIEEVLFSMIAQYRSQSAIDEVPDAEAMALSARLAVYEQAREYWRKNGNPERAAMTDQQLDEQFWLFDADGIPRLKADQHEVVLPASSLYRAGQMIRSAGFRSGQSDISIRSREILNDEFADYLLSRDSNN